MGWHPASSARVVVSLLLPAGLAVAVENWLALAIDRNGTCGHYK